MAEPEIPLAGGNMSSGVVRVGDTVRRPAGAWTPAVHALLSHLDSVGFRGAPRPLGIDEHGREVLTRDRHHRAPRPGTRSMQAFLANQAARGAQPWARLWEEGHGDAWQADTDYITRREHQWNEALLG
jgi:hypothetical protein